MGTEALERSFKILVEIGHIPCGTWEKTADRLANIGFSVERGESITRRAN